VSKAAPGFAKHPQHKITLEPLKQSANVSFAGQVVATSSEALLLHEGRYEPVIYLPFDDCHASLYVSSDTETYCPFKGTASYWSLKVGDELAVDAAWEYRDPYTEMLPIKNFVAFYQSKFDIKIRLT